MPSESNWSLRGVASVGVLVLILVLSIEVISLPLWKADLSVPFNYWGDTLWFVVPVKGIVENGWAYEIPQLSAPFGLSAVAFPSITNLDWLIMKGISLFAKDAGTVLNVFWLLSIVLTAWSATLALSLLGVRIWLAIGVAIVYAFLPFALFRNVAHIPLVYYCVPLLVLLAIYFAHGCDHPQAKKIQLVGYCAVIAQGLNYIYFSFFAVLLFSFAGWLGFIQNRSWKPVKGAIIASLLLIITTSLNLSPSFLSWYEHGKPPDISYKSASEAEIYGLKIRKMLAPNEANRVPFISLWGRSDRSANFPNENENVSARLGPLAAVGFVMLLMVSAGLIKNLPRSEWTEIKPIAALMLFSLLFTTVGGFGAILNQFFPDFRGYNRFSVFIAFLALAGVSLWWQARIQLSTTPRAKKILLVGLLFFGVFSLYDQLLDAVHLNNRRPIDEASAAHEREFVTQLEAKVLPETSVFQLPITGFPPDGGIEKMLPYDHARPYLWSSKLNWSWPSFSQQHRNWLFQLNGLTGAELAEALVFSKFGAIWIDRWGYADNGEQMISSLIAAGTNDILPGISPRYVALELSRVIERLQNQLGPEIYKQRQETTLGAVAPHIILRKGFYGWEGRAGAFTWSSGDAELWLNNTKKNPINIKLHFKITTLLPRNVIIGVDGDSQGMKIFLKPGEPQKINLSLNLVFGKTKLKFKTDQPAQLAGNGDPRKFSFSLSELYIEDIGQ